MILSLLLLAAQGVDARFEDALKRLDADEYKTRQAAAQEIAALPAEALALVEAALKRPGLSVEARARLEETKPALRARGRRDLQAKKNVANAAWVRKTVAEAYETAGRRDPKWDAPARETLRVMSLIWADLPPGMPNGPRHAFDLAGKAVAAGCDDPMIVYIHARMYDVAIHKSMDEAVKLHVGAGAAMKERGAGYHPARRAFTFFRAGEFLARSKKQLSEEEKKAAQDWLELAAATFAEGLKDVEVPDPLIMEFGEGLATAWNTLTRDRKPGFDQVHEALLKHRPDSLLAPLLKGRVYVTYAWDARGGGWANSVTEDGWAKMKERLAAAEEALTAAYEKDPFDAEAPTQMLVVELGQGKGRDVMEKWYQRAMKADPDNIAACKKKMYYLEPKWHGGAEPMLEFGRELLKGGNWGALLPFQLVDAHLTLAGYEKDKSGAYWSRPGVWEDLKSVYDAALAHDPKNDYWRSFYAKLACRCGQFAEARRQFEAVGERARLDAFKDKAELDRLRAEANEKGR
jgi:hypothetical protein